MEGGLLRPFDCRTIFALWRNMVDSPKTRPGQNCASGCHWRGVLGGDNSL